MEGEQSQIGLLFVLLAAVWASTSAQVAGYRAVHEKRDTIILGAIGSKPLTLEHRRLLYRNDWLPLKLGLGVVSLSFAVIILISPLLIPPPAEADGDSAIIWLVVCLVAAMPLFAAFSWFILGFSDARLIRKALSDAAQGRNEEHVGKAGLATTVKEPSVVVR